MTARTVRQTRKVVEKNALKMGYWVSTEVAASGSTYIECSPIDVDKPAIKIRVADHCQYHGGSQMSISPAENTLEQAIRFLAEYIGAKVPAWVIKNEKAQAEAEAAKAVRRAEEDEYMRKQAERILGVYELLVEHEPQAARQVVVKNGRVGYREVVGKKFWDAVKRCEERC